MLVTVKAFAPADEEQGRKALHSYWQVWTEEPSQDLQDMLFHKDKEVQDVVRRQNIAFN